MKRFIFLFLLAFPCHADDIVTVSLGSPGPLDIQASPEMILPINLPITPLHGQQDIITINFNGESLSSNWYFDADLVFATNGPPCSGFTSGIGTFIGVQGQSLFDPIALGNSCGSNSQL